MENILELRQVSKTYPKSNFMLDKVSFSLPYGAILGIVGENGAGKTTTIKTILGLIQKDAGTIAIFGKQEEEIDFSVRNQIGVVFVGNNFPDTLTPKELSGLLRAVYPVWNENKYFASLKKLSLPTDKKIKTFSAGMKRKLSIAAAVSHQSRLLILDEATSGLDPVARDEILDMFLEFVQDESHSILVSSHITSDLEKIADYILFIHQGKVVFQKPKDELRYKYAIIKCGAAQFHKLEKSEILACRKQEYEWQVLVADKDAARRKYPKAVIDPATMDEIMLFYVKGEQE